MVITLEGGVLLRGARDTFLFGNVRVFAFIALRSAIIGYPPTLLSIIIEVLPRWTSGRQSMPLVSPDGTVHIR